MEFGAGEGIQMVEGGRHVGLQFQENGMYKIQRCVPACQIGGILRTPGKRRSWVLSSNLGFFTKLLHDLGQVTEIVWISVSLSMIQVSWTTLIPTQIPILPIFLTSRTSI